MPPEPTQADIETAEEIIALTYGPVVDRNRIGHAIAAALASARATEREEAAQRAESFGRTIQGAHRIAAAIRSEEGNRG